MVDFRTLDLVSKKKRPKKKPAKKIKKGPTGSKRFSFSLLTPDLTNAQPDEPAQTESRKFSNLISKRTPFEKNKIEPVQREKFRFRDIPLRDAEHPVKSDVLQTEKKELVETFDEPLPDGISVEIPEISPPSVTETSSTSISPEMEQSRKDLYENTAEYLDQVLNSVRTRRGFSLHPGSKLMHKMVEVELPNDPLFISAIQQDNPTNFIVYHSVNVAIFSIKMGQCLGFSKSRQVEIGLAGLLHDVGMSLIPKEIIFKQNKLTQQEIHLLRERPEFSFKILNRFGEAYAYLAETALQVYERIDGSGYPNGTQADDIHEYAQIIGLLNVYEALIHSRPQRQKFLHFSAVKEIIKNNKKGFQRKHLKALLNIFSIFPVSSFVKLNSNAIGRVIETDPNHPMRPKVRIMYDSQNQKVLTERVVDLSKETLLYIVDAVADEELSELSMG